MPASRLVNCLIVLLLSVAATAVSVCLMLFYSSQAIVASVDLVNLGSAAISVAVVLDSVSAMFVGTVTLISAAVMLFSSSYMANEKFQLRFHILVMAFVASMVVLIVSPNLVMVLLGWDGLGVTSYLLVIYFNSFKANNAGMLTALTNRLGDVAILMAIGVAMEWGSLQLIQWSEWAMKVGAIVSLLTVAALTKSAQVPFSAWLPAAMAAPTPVSSLVHSSTLVTAGVYLMVRFYPALVSAKLLIPLLMVGILTMFMASISAMFETDMKKVVALSTLSQLGMMFSALGVGSMNLVMLHLLAHAFFKALLFISVGQIIHLSSDYQDLRMVGQSAGPTPTLSMALIANLSLMGAPFMSGFFSKDAILEMASVSQMWLGGYLLLLLSVFATAMYSVRFILLATVNGLNSQSTSSTLDSDSPMFGSMLMLWPLAVLGGSILLWELASRPMVFALPVELKILALFFLLTGSIISIGPNYSVLAPVAGWTWGSMWALPFSSQMYNKPMLANSKDWRKFDQSWMFIIVEPVYGVAQYSSLDSDWAKFMGLLAGLISALAIILWYLCA